MYIYLQEHEYYENLYDRLTVANARRGQYHYDNFVAQLAKKVKQLDPPDDLSRPGNAILMNLAYMQILGYELLERYDKREQTIVEWMERDQTEDLVLLLFRCNNCHKNSAYWEDGAPYQISHDDTSKDVEEVEEASPPKKRSYKNHDIKDVTDPYYWDIDPEHDLDYAKDRYKFCFHDESWLKRLRDVRDGLEKMSKLGRYFAERDQREDIIRASERIKKLSVAEVINNLTLAIEAKHYAKINFSAPQTGRYLTIEFGCIDLQPSRQASRSIRDLKHIIDKELLLTNWQLMRDGVHYRLGVLFGRLKAIENPDEIKKLAEKLSQSGKIKLPKETETKKSDKNDSVYTEIAPDGTIIHL